MLRDGDISMYVCMMRTRSAMRKPLSMGKSLFVFEKPWLDVCGRQTGTRSGRKKTGDYWLGVADLCGR